MEKDYGVWLYSGRGNEYNKFYRCSKCGHKVELTRLDDPHSIHLIKTCPNCGIDMCGTNSPLIDGYGNE